MRLALALIPAVALVACKPADNAGNGAANGSAPVQSAAPVAAVAPPAGKQWTDVVEKTKDGGYRQGNPNAPIKLVEYGSRNCPACGAFAATGVEPLREKYIKTGKVSYEFRDFLIHGAPDLAAALLNQCVPTESFFVVMDQFFANQPVVLDRTENLVKNRPDFIQQVQQMTAPQAAVAFADALGMVDFMKQRGLTEAQARACLTDQKKIEEIAKVYSDGGSVYGVNSTPSFFINGVKNDADRWERLEPLLQQAGAR